MDSRTCRDIDFVINKKLNKSIAVKSTKNQLLKFLNYSIIRDYDAIRHASFISELVSTNSMVSQKDMYNNSVCNFLDYTVVKTRTNFNLLRLFKPGELLSAVISA